jgi:polar amino acid transport system substrate-binding protein
VDVENAAGRAAARQALAPGGTLRVAVAVGPAASATFATRDSVGGRPRGVPVDLGALLASELQLPVDYVEYASSGEITAAAASGAWDVTFVPVDEERRRVLDFGPDYSLFESTFLVSAASAIMSSADVDRAGVSVGAIEGTTTARGAARSLQNATLATYGSVDALRAALARGEVDALALSRASLESLAAGLPGARVLDGAFHATSVAIAVPKGRTAALAYVRDFMERAKAAGAVRRALDEAGLDSVTVAPPEG